MTRNLDIVAMIVLVLGAWILWPVARAFVVATRVGARHHGGYRQLYRYLRSKRG